MGRWVVGKLETNAKLNSKLRLKLKLELSFATLTLTNITLKAVV